MEALIQLEMKEPPPPLSPLSFPLPTSAAVAVVPALSLSEPAPVPASSSTSSFLHCAVASAAAGSAFTTASPAAAAASALSPATHPVGSLTVIPPPPSLHVAPNDLAGQEVILDNELTAPPPPYPFYLFYSPSYSHFHSYSKFSTVVTAMRKEHASSSQHTSSCDLIEHSCEHSVPDSSLPSVLSCDTVLDPQYNTVCSSSWSLSSHSMPLSIPESVASYRTDSQCAQSSVSPSSSQSSPPSLTMRYNSSTSTLRIIGSAPHPVLSYYILSCWS